VPTSVARRAARLIALCGCPASEASPRAPGATLAISSRPAPRGGDLTPTAELRQLLDVGQQFHVRASELTARIDKLQSGARNTRL